MRIRTLSMVESRKPEPTVALINIVFLILIFFLIAGTLAPPLDPDLTLINTSALEGREPPDALVAHADGSLTFRQQAVTIADYLADFPRDDDEPRTVRIVPDQNLPAVDLIALGDELRAAGAARIFIVTERALQ